MTKYMWYTCCAIIKYESSSEYTTWGNSISINTFKLNARWHLQASLGLFVSAYDKYFFGIFLERHYKIKLFI